MKIVTYNINGLRAAVRQGLLDWIEKENADIYCFQEVRASEQKTREILKDENQIMFFKDEKTSLTKYKKIYNCGNVAGYAGTLILTKKTPSLIKYDMENFWQDNEGRTTTIIFEDEKLAVVNAYIPNGTKRLDFKLKYLECLIKYLRELKEKYTVICLGDFNIAHKEIDLTNPKECKNRSVFLPIERSIFSKILNLGFIDAFRNLYPDKIEYSWRSYKSRQDSEKSNQGKNFWKYRIDYILYSKNEDLKATKCTMPDLIFSDHLPVRVEFDCK